MPTEAAVSDSALITKATLRAAERLGVRSKTLARIIGVSEATISRMKHGNYPLRAAEKPFELAVLFVLLFRSLDARRVVVGRRVLHQFGASGPD